MKCCVLTVHIIQVYTCANLAPIEDQKHPHHQTEVELTSPVAVLISLSRNSSQKHHHRSQGSDLSVILRGLKKGQKKEISFLEQNRTIFIFSAYTDACTYFMQNSRSLKEALIPNGVGMTQRHTAMVVALSTSLHKMIVM